MFERYLALAGGMGVLAVVVGAMMPSGTDTESTASVTAEATTKTDTEPKAKPSGGPRVTIERAADSHFYTEVELDGNAVKMIVDSGASTVVLPRNLATKAGIDVDAVPLGGAAMTAGGAISLRPYRFRSVRVGSIVLRDVDGAIIDTDMPNGLLGQSFLKRLRNVRVIGDAMTLG